MTQQGVSAALILCNLALFSIGLMVLALGRILPKQGGWMVSAGLTLMIAGAVVGGSALMNEGVSSKTWIVGWIWPRDEMGAVRLGILQDSAGLVMTAVTALVSAVLMLDGGLLSRESKAERLYAALAFSTCGVAVAWIALTPWVAFVGLALTTFGGFVSFGSHWDQDSEAVVAIRFAWERCWGLLLAIIGTCILASTRVGLTWNNPEVWKSAAGAGITLGDQIGAALLVAGLFIQLQPFPFLGLLIRASEVPYFVRIILTQVFPAWAAFAALVRINPQLVALGVFPNFGWIALASAVFSLVSGFFQSGWQRAFALWVSAGFSITIATLAFAGPWPALATLLGVSLGGGAFSSCSSALEAEGSATSTNRNRALWAKVGAFFSAGAASGLVGFVSANSGTLWIASSWEQPLNSMAFIGVLLLSTILLWKLVFQITREKTAIQVPWISVLSPFVLIFLSLGFLWTGTISGGVIPRNPDEILPSVLNLFFGVQGGKALDEAITNSASIVYWTTLVIAIGIAFWLSRMKTDFRELASESTPRLTRFFAGGYGFDALFEKIYRAARGSGAALEKAIDQKFWNQWVPQGALGAIRRISSGWASAENRISVQSASGIRRAVEIPGKALQLIQSGDVQWYVFFAVGSLVAMLLHFWRS